ncbi:hypothetical protein MHYP_G00331050 [Metynnis hypsauchen]
MVFLKDAQETRVCPPSLGPAVVCLLCVALKRRAEQTEGFQHRGQLRARHTQTSHCPRLRPAAAAATRPARRRRAHLHLNFRCNWTDQTLISAKAQQAEDGADAGPGLCLTTNTASVPSAHTSPSALSPSQKGEIRGQTESSRA